MKKFEITEEQIKELSKTKHGKRKVKEWYPEVFETKLEVGKWMKTPDNGLYCPKEKTKDGYICYGFSMKGDWIGLNVPITITKLDIDATESEVLEALKNEAIKRGLIDGAYFITFYGAIQKIKGEPYLEYTGDLHVSTPKKEWNNKNCVSNPFIFRNGQWAEIVKTYTKEEAEKLLNCKII